MKKRTYRGVEVKKVNRERLAGAVAGQDLVVGVDVGKEVCFGSLRGAGQEVEMTVKWKSPGHGAEWELWGSVAQSSVGSRDSCVSSQCEAEPRCGGGL